MTPQLADPLLSPEEAALMVHREFPVRLIRRAITRGLLRHVDALGKVYIPQSALAEWIAASTCHAKQARPALNSSAPTPATAHGPERASTATSGTSPGMSSGAAANSAQALQIAQTLKGLSRRSSPSETDQSAQVIPLQRRPARTTRRSAKP